MEALYILIGLVVGAAVAYTLARGQAKKADAAAEELAEKIRKEAERDAERLLKDAELKAKDEMIKLREAFEEETRERRRDQQEQERALAGREKNLDRKMDLIQKRLDDVSRRDTSLAESEREVATRKADLEELVQKQVRQLEAVAAMTRDQARVQLMQALERELMNERGTLIRRSIEDLKTRCQREAQKILIETMQRYAGECAYDRTTATVPLPSDEMKGRIIGREGRNIRVFESITGVNVLIDDTPSAVVITCFDPVRREVARLGLERLVADGRIHPTRVEEVIAKAREDIQEEIVKAGEEALHELGIVGVKAELVKMLGRLRYRYSYSQNVLQHATEVGHFMGMIAAQLGLDVDLAKRMGLFHDIGKAMDHDVEGSHAIIGMEFLKRHGEDPRVVNAVGCHHDEVAAQSPLAALVSVCDALSASRPGARSETTEIYLKRLEALEEIGREHPGVDLCYAVQAGREIRIVVEPEKVTENEALVMARGIAGRIEKEVQYPGQIKVSVIRETRAIEYAK